jgi:hypothetical protein
MDGVDDVVKRINSLCAVANRAIPGPLVLRAVVVNRLPGTGFRPPETDAPKGT